MLTDAMARLTHEVRPFFRVNARQPLKELYFFSLLFSLAQSSMFIFEPVFFYQQGISLSRIALYYALHYSLYVLALPFGGSFAARFGLERSLAVSTPLFVLYFLTLAAMPSQPRLFWLAVMLLTLHKIFYWPAYHADVARYSQGDNRGTELSWMYLIVHGVGIIGPLIGGLVAAAYGFPALFMLAAMTAVLSSLPLLLTKEHYHSAAIGYGEPWRIIGNPAYRGMVVAMSGMGEHLIYMVFWPIFLFMLIGTVGWFGVVSTVGIASMTVVGFVIGELVDRYHHLTVLRRSVPLKVVSHVIRPFAIGPISALVSDVLSRIAFISVDIPMALELYTQGRRAGLIQYMTAFEMVLAMAKAITAFILVAVFFFFLPSTGFVITFLLAAALSWLYWFLR